MGIKMRVSENCANVLISRTLQHTHTQTHTRNAFYGILLYDDNQLQSVLQGFTWTASFHQFVEDDVLSPYIFCLIRRMRQI